MRGRTGGRAQPAGFLHRAHVEGTQAVCRQEGANLLIHARADTDYYSRVRSYQAVLPVYPEGSAVLAVLALAERAADARDILWRAIIAKNYGCGLLLVDPGVAPVVAV